MNARELTDVIWCVLACSLMVLNAIVPKGLHDGRFTAWTQKHPIVTGGLIFLIMGSGLVFLLSDHVAKWLAAVIALPLSAAFVAWMTAYRLAVLNAVEREAVPQGRSPCCPVSPIADGAIGAAGLSDGLEGASMLHRSATQCLIRQRFVLVGCQR
ncbi:hypothetical protein [Kribbella catacumbae]|uniref:hypothetical protein n=1 Tax=Kribbella catacumbae TaxID=460086 RepID=UPI0003A46656|nr:hypothetical protein [Kribbella catacumbae]